jgi:BASS family bile acid:Na+ symporter
VWLLSATYVLGALAPTPGLLIRSVHFGTIPLFRSAGALSLPMVMLGFLLVVAGMGAGLEELRHVIHRPGMLATGFVTNAVYPIAFAVLMSLLLAWWHSSDEAQSILVGLAMIGAMPIAGSSTAWSQNADGNLALSLGLVWSSTALSPLLTPLGLHAVGLVTHGDYSEDLHELARQGSSAFVVVAVLLPSLIGIALQAVLGRRRIARLMPALKLINLVNLLALNYTNAAAALPGSVAHPDWDFLALTLAVTATMCVGAFAAGWWIPRLFHAGRADRVALTFGIGMNNNGTGLVLAAAALADHELVLLPIILYNLVQQMIAGVVDALQRRHTHQAAALSSPQ